MHERDAEVIAKTAYRFLYAVFAKSYIFLIFSTMFVKAGMAGSTFAIIQSI